MSMNIFESDTTQERAENARLASFVGALALGDLVKSTLGPKGMNKFLHSATTGEITVTNDGATILKSIPLDNPAAKVLVNISKVQDDEVGDGTTSVTVLAAELLREAEKLVTIQRIHPQVVVDGFRIAARAALAELAESAVDRSTDRAALERDLLNIARTTLSSKVLAGAKDYFAHMAVDAVLRLGGSTDLDHIQIIKKQGGKLTDSYLADGFLLDRRVGSGGGPRVVAPARILIANTSLDADKIKVFGARVRVEGTRQLAELEAAEREKMREKIALIRATGANCIVNRQLIYNFPESLLAEAGIMAIEHADFEGVERLALVTGGEIASTFDGPIRLGTAARIEEVMVGEDKLTHFVGVSGRACTVVLRGSTTQMLDEADRSLHDALSVLSQTVAEPRTTLGGGCAEMRMAIAVDAAARATDGKQALAVEAFARALRQIPTILADNAGFDSADLVARLRAAHYDGQKDAGLDMDNATIVSMADKGITESYKLKRQVVISASEAAEMILRVDDVIKAAPRRREGY